MNRKTLKALKGSIKKWEGIVAGELGDEGTDNCPLCELFYLEDCEGCPVLQKTGYSHCLDTPYDDFADASWMHGQVANTPWRIRAAKAELKFLKSLLPRN